MNPSRAKKPEPRSILGPLNLTVGEVEVLPEMQGISVLVLEPAVDSLVEAVGMIVRVRFESRETNTY